MSDSHAELNRMSSSTQRLFPRYFIVIITIFSIITTFVLDVVLTSLIHGGMIIYTPENNERAYRIQSSYYHHDLAPNVHAFSARWGGGRYTIYTNSLGFKDAIDRKVALFSPVRRILFLGDSFTEGIGIEYPQTFVGLIGSALAVQNIEVLNGAVASYSPIIYLAKVKYLLSQGLRFDHVVVFLDISDPQDEAVFYENDANGRVVYRQDAPIVKQGSGFAGWLSFFIDKNTTVYRQFTRLVAVFLSDSKEAYRRSSLKRGKWTFDQAAFDEFGRTGLDLMKKHMNELLDLLRQKHVGLTIAVYPWPDQIVRSERDSIQVKYWEQWAKLNDVGFVNYFPFFVDSRYKPDDMINRYFIKGDVHWNVNGHKMVADVFQKHISGEMVR